MIKNDKNRKDVKDDDQNEKNLKDVKDDDQK